MDYLIIGAGPAGLQLGYYLARAGHSFKILESGTAPGAFFQTFPRHRQLISINKPYTGTLDAELNLRMDWNSLLSDDSELLFTRYSARYFPSADDYVRYLADFARRFALPICYGARVVEVTRPQDYRVLDAQGHVYTAKRLIVATGVSKPNVPSIPGIELAECYTAVSVNAADFVNQRVLIIGKGNSAFETADHLMETAATVHLLGPSALKFAWRTHYVGHLRAVNNNFLDTYQLKSQNAVLDGHVDRIERRAGKYVVTIRFTRADETMKDIEYDRVIYCTGFRFDSEIFADDCRPRLAINDRFPEQTSAWESTNVPGLYFAGTLSQMRDYRRTTSGFIHGFRYCVRALHHVLEHRYHGVQWPSRSLSATPAACMRAVIERVNRSSALWQQFGFLADVITVDGAQAHYYQELPMDYVHEHGIGGRHDYFTVTLEYGPNHDQVDPFDIDVGRIAQSDAGNADLSAYLHPVVRRFQRGRLLAEHHVTENLENDWTGTVHTEPLEAFFTRELRDGAVVSETQ